MIHVRFVGAEGKFQSIETQAVRIHSNLEHLAPGRVCSSLSLLPQDHFVRKGLLRRLPVREIEAIADGVDVLVIVKSSLFKEFLHAAPALKEACRKRGVVIASNPCDGPGADSGDTADEFTETIADYALAVSRLQADAIAKKRPANEVLLVAHSSRLETTRSLEYRHPVRRVIWENAIHHNPRFDPRKVAMPRARYQELEDAIRALLTHHGAELVFIEAWRETQTYAEWEAMMLASDIAIECKGLGNQYVDYQSQKPAVKVLNYLSLGLPVVCDTHPAYRELGEHDKQLLFADTLEDWARQLTRLLEEPVLRRRLGESAKKAAEPFSIDNTIRRYADFFEAMVRRERDTARPVSLRA